MVQANEANQKPTAAIKTLLKIEIIDIKQAEGTSFFVVKCSKLHDQTNWTVQKRYSNFFDLHAEITSLAYTNLPSFPAKKFFMSNAQIEARKSQLERYLQELVERKDTRNSGPIRTFLGLDEYFPELLFNKPKLIVQKKLEKREQITSCEYIERYNMYILGILATKGSRLEINVFQSTPSGTGITSFADRQSLV